MIVSHTEFYLRSLNNQKPGKTFIQVISQEKSQILQLLESYSDSVTDTPGRTTTCKHVITLSDRKPPQYSISLHYEDAVISELKEPLSGSPSTFTKIIQTMHKLSNDYDVDHDDDHHHQTSFRPCVSCQMRMMMIIIFRQLTHGLNDVISYLDGMLVFHQTLLEYIWLVYIDYQIE